jgi:hypothetical protein
MRVQGFFISGGTMFTMQVIQATDSPLELKYCEFCGALWMRPRGSADVYCPPCAGWIKAELPQLAQGEA